MSSETEVLQAGISYITQLLGGGFDLRAAQSDAAGGPVEASATDELVEVRDRQTGTYATLLVEAQRNVTPVTIRRDLAPRFRLMARLPSKVTPLVVAPWISPHAQAELRAAGACYLDLTGNVLLDINNPRVFVRTQGARMQATTQPASVSKLNGPKAGRLVRLLVDHAPPYRAAPLATAASLSLPYVTRLLEQLDDRGLIGRAGRNVTEVDWAGLLRARSATSNLLNAAHRSYLATQGTDHLSGQLASENAERLAAGSSIPAFTVTGSVAAAAVAPVAVEGLLHLYIPVTGVNEFEDAARRLGLLAVKGGGDVMLLRAPDPVVFSGSRDIGGVPHVALSQLALDCLSGPGRLPAEGEAVLDYMLANETAWRHGALPGGPS